LIKIYIKLGEFITIDLHLISIDAFIYKCFSQA